MIQSLAQLDFAVIALALGDSVSGVTRRARLARWIFGKGSSGLPLANPKLEALRKYVVLRRQHGDMLPADEHAPLRDAGYSIPDMSEIDRLIDNPPVSRR